MMWQILLLVLILTIFFSRRPTQWSKQGIYGPGFFEYVRNFSVSTYELGVKMAKKYGKVYYGYGLLKGSLTINEPEIIRKILVENFEAFPDHLDWNVGSNPNVSNMLVLLPGRNIWKRIRSVVTPGFTPSKLKTMIPAISEVCDQLMNTLATFEKSDYVDIRKIFGSFSIDVICSCIYGIKIDSINNPDHPIVVHVKRFFHQNVTLGRIIAIISPRIAAVFKCQFFESHVVDFFSELTKKIVADRECQGDEGKRSDVMQLMIDSLNNNDQVSDSIKKKHYLTIEEMTAQGVGFFMGGFDPTLPHIIYYLSKHKECQQKLYEELQECNDFSFETLIENKYLNAVIYETLRLAPPVLVIPRECIKDMELNGIKIPAGTSIHILPYVVHRDPEYWTDPEEFKPERFIDPKHNPWAFIPFGGGPRTCPGHKFALNEIRVCIAKLFLKFQFSLKPGFNLEYFSGNIVFDPKHLFVKIESR